MRVNIILFQIGGNDHLGNGTALQVHALFDKDILAYDLRFPGNPADAVARAEDFGKCPGAYDIAGTVKGFYGGKEAAFIPQFPEWIVLDYRNIVCCWKLGIT